MNDFITKGFFTGLNYWESKHATHMWREFDEAVIESDFRAMKATGISALRVFPLWSDFQPLVAACTVSSIYELTFDGNPLPDTEAGRAGVSEEMCRRFERFCALADKYDLKLIVGLITGQMSFGMFPPPAFQGRNWLTDPLVIRWQLRFIKYFVKRFRSQQAIVGWDLGNEVDCLAVNCSEDGFFVWCSAMADAIRLADPTRPVVSGLGGGHTAAKGIGNAKDMGEVCDIHTSHPYNIFSDLRRDPLHTMRSILNLPFQCRFKEDISGVPNFMQEYGAIGYQTCSRETEAAFYRGTFLACLAHNTHGIMYWCAFDQGDIDFWPYDWNTIGSQYGFLEKDGVTEKPIAAENRRLTGLLEKLPNGLPPYERDCTIVIAREEGGGGEIMSPYLTAFCLAKRAGLDASFTYALDPIPDSPLYFMPCPKGNKSITKHRLNELLAKVSAGAHLYISLSAGLFRELPETCGVCIDWRIDRRGRKNIHFGADVIPAETEYCYGITPTTARVLATDDEGNGIFFENDYGKGKVFLSVVPLEDYVTLCPGAFYDQNAPKFELFYTAAAAGLPTKKVCTVESPFIRSTEHVVDENTRYVFLINYDRVPHTARLSVSGAYAVETVWGKSYAGTSATIPANDGLLLLLKR